jgi:ribonuclease HI
VSGAGIYIPSRLVTARVQALANDADDNGCSAFYACGVVETAGLAISLAPGGAGATNTITRAEGAAVWYALRHGLGATIATDSAAVLYQIRNMLHRPSTMQHCKNKPLIDAIIDIIRRSPHHIHLQKVKAHIGIPGNELADEGARHATRLQQYADNIPTCDVDPEPPSHNQFWPVPAQDQREPHALEHRHIGDLGKDLKKFLHHKHKIGYSNTASVYYQAWANTVTAAHGRHSNALMLGGKVDPLDRVITQQYRYGGLNTAKLRHRMKVAPTPNCILCGQLDGGHHSLSGCPHMSGMHIERHNKAGHIILKAILQGGRGADVVMHDIGHSQDDSLPQGGGTAMAHATRTGGFATRIPSWVYTKRRNGIPCAQTKQKWDKFRPDMLLIAGTNKVPIHKREADLVEVKYCRDTDRSQQEARANLQHNGPLTPNSPSSLVQSLVDAGYRPSKVRLHVILLGVGGTVYHSMHTALKQLGLKQQAVDRLAIKLHVHATVYTRRIMQTKWNQEFLLKRDMG